MPGDKSEKATSKKREDERKKGHVHQSKDLVSAISLISLFACLKYMAPGFLNKMISGMTLLFEGMSSVITGPGDINSRLWVVVTVSASVILPFAAIVILVSVVTTLAQTRLLFTPGQLKPSFDRMNPIKGIQRLFSLNGLMEVFKSLLKITIIGVMIYFEIRPKIGQVLLLFDSDLGRSISWVGEIVLDVGFKVAIAMLVLGVIDYFYQWWSFERQIMMSKQEIKDEFKQSEGSPEIKGRIRRMQRKMAQTRMMQAVPEADVVIRNPTHYAIALKYEEKSGSAPLVIAKGKDYIALKIVEIAIQNNVSVTENRPLAQALFKTVEIGQEIPSEFYKAVAEVLAYIYKLKRAGRQ
ncbi:MAG TPA: flagellar biosynthesis protein FlhB [Clostridia bacterium]|nr:flagellar biosynthesis protein FlhB [Clostridia bacterium]